MKAIRQGFLKGCPNLSEELVRKYLNPSPAMAKGHMKCPKKGIRSTTQKASNKGASRVDILAPSSQATPPILPIFEGPQPYEGPAYGACSAANWIPYDKSIANAFLFWSFCR
jgi:hypothetical protein